MRRILLALVTATAISAPRAEAVTIRDLIELSKAGVGDPVLLALIEVDKSVFTIDTTTLKQLRTAGLSDDVLVAVIKSGRTQPPPAPATAPEPPSQPAPQQRPEPEVIVIDHHDAPAPAAYPVPVPVAVPVYPTYPYGYGAYGGYGMPRRGITTVDPRRPTTPSRIGPNVIQTTFATDVGLVTAKVPVPPGCVKAEPVYWGFGGQLRPGSYAPPPTVVCR